MSPVLGQVRVLQEDDVIVGSRRGDGVPDALERVLLAAPGALPVGRRLEDLVRAERIGGVGEITRVDCSGDNGEWTCTIYGAGGRREVCTLAVADNKLEGAYCNRRR